jgi:putative solute:sodium symporter small subunit
MPQENLPASDARRYWRVNLYVLGTLLPIWFIVSFGLSILWADKLNEYRLGGFPLGFWISQQGAIFVFVILILFYAWIMGRLDRNYRTQENRPRQITPGD